MTTTTTAQHGFPYQFRAVDLENGEVIVDFGATWEGVEVLRPMYQKDGFHVVVENA